MDETDTGRRVSAVAPIPAATDRAAGRAPGQAAFSRSVGALVIVLPAAVTLVVGGYRLGGPSLWRDEAYTKEVVVRPLGQIIDLLGHQDAVHGAYYVVMHLVAELIGTSPVALRLPSLIAMTITAAVTAAIGRRLAELADGPAPRATGLLAGLVFATAPDMTWYAEDAREYAIVTMFATVASYLFVRAVTGRRWPWWAGYGAAVALAGFFNLFGVLIAAAHAVSLLIARARTGRWGGWSPPGTASTGRQAAGPPATGERSAAVPVRWLVAVVAAGIVLIPLAMVGYRQRGQISWLTKPDLGTLVTLVTDFAGSRALVVPIALLAVGGAVAGLLVRRALPLSPAVVALPWLVVPPVVLLAVSFIHPVYDPRYVEFCLPALAILVAAGLVWLGRLAARTPLAAAGLAWLPSTLVALAVAGLLVGPQQSIRLTSARADNLRKVSAIVAAHERPGDVALYIPMEAHVLGEAYPAPFRRLPDPALAASPVASATLNGTLVSPAVLRARMVGVHRVWVIAEESHGHVPAPTDALERAEVAVLARMRLVHRWRTQEDIVELYAAPSGS